MTAEESGTGSDSADGPTGEPASATVADDARTFYTRYAWLYDLLATRAPLVGRLRRRTVEALAPERGDVVVEFGCGTGANLPQLAEAVGPTGRVVGVDFSGGALDRAAVRAADHDVVDVVRGDATSPPVHAGRVDAVVATFVAGMLPAPAETVAAWADLVGAGGRLCLLDLARSTGRGRPLNPLFRLLTVASSPGGTGRRHDDQVATLDDRVGRAHRSLRERCDDATWGTHLLGFARLSAGTVEPESRA